MPGQVDQFQTGDYNRRVRASNHCEHVRSPRMVHVNAPGPAQRARPGHPAQKQLQANHSHLPHLRQIVIIGKQRVIGSLRAHSSVGAVHNHPLAESLELLSVRSGRSRQSGEQRERAERLESQLRRALDQPVRAAQRAVLHGQQSIPVLVHRVAHDQELRALV